MGKVRYQFMKQHMTRCIQACIHQLLLVGIASNLRKPLQFAIILTAWMYCATLQKKLQLVQIVQHNLIVSAVYNCHRSVAAVHYGR